MESSMARLEGRGFDFTIENTIQILRSLTEMLLDGGIVGIPRFNIIFGDESDDYFYAPNDESGFCAVVAPLSIRKEGTRPKAFADSQGGYSFVLPAK